MNFSKNFIFGVATSAYQIEGGHNDGGRTPSIWDDFCLEPGKVHNGDNGNIACDHYKLFKEDIGLMRELGVDSYRFSISWPRIFPRYGEYNREGMEFYKALVKELKNNNIKAAATMYHWDLPSWAEELGGWGNRESINWFLDFAKKCFEELDDLVDIWITHNEPWCASFLSNYLGKHAPGKRDIDESLRVVHHLLLSHGEAVKLYRHMKGKKPIGLTLNLSPVYPKSHSYGDIIAANNCDVFLNRYFLDPVFKGTYPFELANYFHRDIASFDFIKDGDFDIITEKCDFLGINYYTRAVVEYSKEDFLNYRTWIPDNPVTSMGWEVYPEGLEDLIKRIRREYTDLPIYITENGCAYEDYVDAGGLVHDNERIAYIDKHLRVVSKLNSEGMDVLGYYAWSLLDNFEWAYGYSKRFGLVYVDFQTQGRIPKDSYMYYSSIIKKSKA